MRPTKLYLYRRSEKTALGKKSRRAGGSPASADFQLCAQPFDDELGHQLWEPLSVTRDFLDEVRGAEKKPRIREHEDSLDGGAHLLVHLRHLELVVEIGNRAQ